MSTFLFLDGTGGNEQDLIPMTRNITSETAIINPRKVVEGVFDLENLKFREQMN